MKKLLSVLLVLVLSFSILAVTVSADNMVLLDPQAGDINTTNATYITQEKDSNGVFTGRTIDASSIASVTTVAKAEDNSFVYRNFSQNDSGYGFDGGSARFKNNFTWEFDFSFDKLPATTGDAGCFYIQFGSAWQNAIKFWAVSATDYYVRWASNSNDYVISAISSSNIWNGGAFMLKAGNTYHIKFEVDVRKGLTHVTFTNPYVEVNEDGSFKQKLSQPAGEGVKIFTKTTTSTSALGATQTTSLADIKTGWKRVNVVMQAKSATKLTLSNEKFYIDRFWSMPPELSVDGNNVTATANAINITNFKYYATMPSLLLAVYNGDELVDYGKNSPYAEGTETLTDYKYSATVENLADGTYTVKAFVWNNLDKMQPYDNCLVEKTLTVSGGVATLSE